MNPAVVASWPSGDGVVTGATIPSVAASASSSVEYTDCVVVDEEDRSLVLEKTVGACVVATEDPETEVGLTSVGAAEEPVEVTNGGVDP